MRIHRIIASLAVMAMLASCISVGGGSKPPKELIGFTVRDAAAAGSVSEGALTSAIVVFEPDVEERLDVRRVPVRVDATGIAYLQNATYVDKPARLFQHLLAETLRARTGRLVIEGPDPAIEPRTRVYGRLIEADYDAPNATVTVTYDAIRVAEDGTVTSQRFSYSADAVPAKSSFVAPALNDAANEVALAVAEWVAP